MAHATTFMCTLIVTLNRRCGNLDPRVGAERLMNVRSPPAMCETNVKKIEDAVRALPPDELAAFRTWFHEFDGDVWDRQIERDAKSGKLDTLAAAALKAHREGRTSPL